MTIDTMEELQGLSTGQLVRDEGTDQNVWRVEDGHLVAGSTRVPFSMFEPRLGQLVLDEGLPRVGDVFARGLFRHVLVSQQDEESVRYVMFGVDDENRWTLTGTGTTRFDTFRSFDRCDERPPTEAAEVINPLRVAWDREREQAAQIADLTARVGSPGIDRADLEEALTGWMNNTGNDDDSSLRDLMENFGMTPPPRTENVDWSLTVRGTIWREVDALEGYSVSYIEPETHRVEYVWDVSLDGTLFDRDENECVCNEIDRVFVEEQMRAQGHEDLIDASDEWDYEDADCDNG